MSNPFPELAPFAEPRRVVPRGEVEGWLAEEMRKERDSEVRRTIVAAPPAEQVARETRLAREANVPPAMIAGRADEVERARNADKLLGLAERYPAIGKFAAANPRAAVAAQDDAKSLGFLGEAFDGLKRLGKAAVGQLDAGRLWASGMTWDTLATIDEVATTINYPFAAGTAAVANMFGVDADPDKSARKRQEFLRGAAAQVNAARDERSERDKFGNYWVDATLAGLQSAPAMVAGAVLRNPTAAATVLGGGTAAEGYQSALRSGASKGAAIRYGATTGFAEGALERMPISRLGEMIAQKTPWAKAFVRQLATELPAEQVTTVLQDLSSYAYLPENADKTFEDFLAERPQRALETALATTGGVTATTGTIAAARRATDATAKVVGRVQEARKAKAERQFIDKAEKAATESKLRQRDPEAFRALLKEQAEDAGARNVFIPAEAIRAYQQSDSYDADMDPFDQGGFQEAMDAGGDYVMPIEDALTDLVGTPAWEAIKDDLRLTGGGISSREAATFEEAMDDLVAEMSDKAAEQERADSPVKEQREKLIDSFATQFGESYTAPVARKFAEVLVQRGMTRAERMGIDLDDALGGVTVKQVLPEGVAEAVKADQIDLVVNAMRQGQDAEAGVGESLLQWIRARGGINDTGGDLKSVGAPANILRKFDPQASMGGITGEGDYGLDSTLRAAVEAGFFPEMANVDAVDLDVQALIDAIGGEPVYRETRTDPYRQAGEELRDILSDAGLDPDTASDREIRDALARFEGSADGRAYEQEARGRIVFDGAKRTIELFQSRNLSTALHEMSHMWLEELMFDASLPDAPEQMKADAEAVKAYFAANGHAMEGTAIPVEAHELWARSGERYFMEGKAPSSALVRLFESFRAWLIGIYKVVDRLRAPITPEIREVFDRLIATDEEIAAAQERQALGQLFKDAATIGMSEAEFSAYQQQVDDARAGAHASLIDKTMRAVRRRETERYRKARKGVVAEEKERIDGSPLYRAIAMMRDTRISKEWIEDTLGLDAPGLLPVRVPPLYVEKGVDPQIVAELSGYASAREMLESLIGAERAHRQAKEGGDKRSMRQRAIDTAADAEMLRRYGDPLNDGSIEREALAAVHSEMQGEVIASELRVLSRRTGNRPTPYRIARDWARAKVRQGIVADEASAGAIQRYARNAAKAGRESEKAMLADDVGEAFRQKQFQMMNNALVAEAKAAADEVDVAVRRMDKIARVRTRKSVDQNYLEQAQALLEAVDLRRRSQVGIDRKDKWEAWAAAREAEGHTVVMPERFEWTGTNWTRIPVDALLALDEQIKQIMYLGRKKQELLTAKKDRELAVVTSAIQDTIRAQRPDVIKDWRNRNTLGQRLRSSVKELFAVHRKMASLARQIDGGVDGGPLVKALILPMTDRYNWEAEQHTAANLKLSEILNPFLGRTSTGRNKMTSGSVFFPSIGHSFNLEERLIIVANMGNEGNLQRLLDGERVEDGFNWSMDDLLAIRDSLTKEQMDAVQAIWDFFESYKPLIAAKERSVNGVEPEWVEPTPVETVHGTYRGGYFPIKYDPARSTKAQQQSDADEAQRQMQGAFTASTTRRSFVKERADKVQMRPLRYSFSTVTSGISEVIHDLAFHEYLIDANRLMRHPKVGDEIRKRFGPEVLKQFTEGLEDVAVGNAPAANAWEGALNHVRFGATIAGLGWNLKTAMLQPFGLTQSIVRVGPKWIARGLREWTMHPAALPRRVHEKSSFMRERSRTMSREVNEIQNRVQGRTASRQFMEASFFYMIVKMQMTVDLPTWWGAYEKAIAADEIEAEAVLMADQAVKDAQGGGQIGDLARIQRGGPLMKLWTNFYSFFSTTYNLTAESVARTKFTRPSDVVAFMSDMVLLYSIPAMMGVALDVAFAAMRGDDEEEEENLAAKLAGEQISYAMGTMVGLREMTGLGQSVAEWISGEDIRVFDGAYGGPAGLRALQELDRFGQQAAQGEMDRALRKSAINAAGVVFHMPSGQINKTLDGAMSLAEGDSENPLVLASGI